MSVPVPVCSCLCETSVSATLIRFLSTLKGGLLIYLGEQSCSVSITALLPRAFPYTVGKSTNTFSMLQHKGKKVPLELWLMPGWTIRYCCHFVRLQCGVFCHPKDAGSKTLIRTFRNSLMV